MEIKRELSLEILEEAISKLPPVTRPIRLRVSYSDYHKFRETCNFLGILPEIAKNVSPGFGMQIVPDVEVADGHYEVDWSI